MQKLKNNSCFLLLVFLAIFGFSIGTFDNYRELWMSANGLSTSSISRVISVSYLVTVLVLFYFTIRVSPSKLKGGMLIALILNMVTGASLICLNGTDEFFLMNFFMFFNIAFSQLILASVYPLMMNISKDDVLYTKKSFVESFFSKLGFLCVAILLGKVLFSKVLDYNFCLLLSVLFNFFAFLVLLCVQVPTRKNSRFNIKETFSYFNMHKILYFFLFVNLFGDLIWGAILGMPMLLLTERLSLSSTVASFMVLGLGICSTILSMVIVKHFRFKNDHYNLIVKYGIRVFLYFFLFVTNSKMLLFFTIVYLFLLDVPYSFIFSSYFINKIEEKYSLFLTTLKYCSSLLGKSLGTFICGIFFHFEIRYFILPVFLISVVHYILASILVSKKVNFE